MQVKESVMQISALKLHDVSMGDMLREEDQRGDAALFAPVYGVGWNLSWNAIMNRKRGVPVEFRPADEDICHSALPVSGGKADGSKPPTSMLTAEEEEILAKQPIFLPLSGDESSHFQLRIYEAAMEAFAKSWSSSKLNDGYAFQAALRFLSAMYYFLGNSSFAKDISIELKVSESTISRWLNGQSAPVVHLRNDVLACGERFVRHLEKTRRSGAHIQDIALR